MTLALESPAIHLITNGELTAANFDERLPAILDLVTIAKEVGVQLIQVREKRLDPRRAFKLIREVMTITRGSRTNVMVNDRADLAAAAGADGVHLTSNSIPPDVIKKNFPALIAGVSTHSSAEVKRASEAGADFALVGPVFATPGKGEPLGIEALESICRASTGFPVLAVGGIDESNFRSVIEAGAAGFAAIRALNDPERLRSIAAIINR